MYKLKLLRENTGSLDEFCKLSVKEHINSTMFFHAPSHLLCLLHDLVLDGPCRLHAFPCISNLFIGFSWRSLCNIRVFLGSQGNPLDHHKATGIPAKAEGITPSDDEDDEHGPGRILLFVDSSFHLTNKQKSGNPLCGPHHFSTPKFMLLLSHRVKNPATKNPRNILTLLFHTPFHSPSPGPFQLRLLRDQG